MMDHNNYQRIWFSIIGRPSVQWLIRWWWVIAIFILTALAFCCATLTPQQQWHAVKLQYRGLQQDAIYAIENDLLTSEQIEQVKKIDKSVVTTITDVEAGRLALESAIVDLEASITRMGEIVGRDKP